MGNLLTYNPSFAFDNIDRGRSIENLSKAIDEAMAFGDSIYITPGLYSTDETCGKVFEFLRNSSFDHQLFQDQYPWITESQYEALISISFIFQVTTPDEANSFEELEQEFTRENNAFIGIEAPCPRYLVHHVPSWTEYHKVYVSKFSFDVRCAKYKYFKKFFQPGLVKPFNLLRNEIRKGKVHHFLKRLDPPLIIHEQIHVHFNDDDDSALNLDGTWKHGECVIPMVVRRILSEWGFLLPEDCYH